MSRRSTSPLGVSVRARPPRSRLRWDASTNSSHVVLQPAPVSRQEADAPRRTTRPLSVLSWRLRARRALGGGRAAGAPQQDGLPDERSDTVRCAMDWEALLHASQVQVQVEAEAEPLLVDRRTVRLTFPLSADARPTLRCRPGAVAGRPELGRAPWVAIIVLGAIAAVVLWLVALPWR